ncbi:hypothetical protein J6590_061192 [Homalodisca vitripennis]|nr:hypothetical protein J6590_061192 [Homalodisca vitripennis]
MINIAITVDHCKDGPTFGLVSALARYGGSGIFQRPRILDILTVTSFSFEHPMDILKRQITNRKCRYVGIKY